MAGLEVHFLPEATIISEGGVTLVLGSLFLGIPVLSSCFSSATIWVSYEAGLSGLVLSGLFATLSETSIAEPDRSAWRSDSVFLQLWSASALTWV